METKTHFFVTLVSLVFLGIIVVKPDALQRDEDRNCKIEKGRIDCQIRTADKVARVYSHKFSEDGIE